MGVVKRIQGWRDSAWPIPNTLQMLVGLLPYRDPEAFRDRKLAEREGREERRAIQSEGSIIPQTVPIIPAQPAIIPAKPEPVRETRTHDPNWKPATVQGTLF